jgi:prepilin-type processing-associated H-X9-DG protein
MHGPCVLNCTNDWGGAYSFHPGGMNVLLCDGSVRFLKETIDREAFRALTTKAGGEVIGED